LAGQVVSLADRGTAVPAGVRALIPNTTSLGGPAMKLSVCGLLMLLTGSVLLGLRQPAAADPPPREPVPPTEVVRAPIRKPQPPEDALAKRVREAQEKAVEYLKKKQTDRGGGAGDWDQHGAQQLPPGGGTSLALLALLESGVKPDDEVAARGLKYLRTVEPKQTYVVALQTQVFCRANRRQDADLIKRNVKWLEAAAVRDAGQLTGWTYTAGGGRSDNSNSRYAIAALHAAHRAGFKVENEGFWAEVRDLYVRTQKENGGWGYVPQSPTATHTMTASGLLCLYLAKDILEKEDRPAEQARLNGEAWIAREFRLDQKSNVLYNFDVVAALGRASEKAFLGPKDPKREWYREGVDWLLKNQKDSGEWQPGGAIDGNPIVSTSFALRFLASRPD
jgi:hypothetical protein